MPPPTRATALLINPNSNARTTEAMVAIARRTVVSMGYEAEFTISGETARSGPAMITGASELALSAPEVLALAERALRDASPPAGIIIAAFGDPGLSEVASLIPGRVVGIGSSGLLEAADGGRRFAVATTTPGLVDAIAQTVERLGLANRFTGTRLTRSPPLDLATDPTRTVSELAEAIERAVQDDGAEAVVIGGGPLAEAARTLSATLAVPLVEPVPAAVRRLLAAIGSN